MLLLLMYTTGHVINSGTFGGTPPGGRGHCVPYWRLTTTRVDFTSINPPLNTHLQAAPSPRVNELTVRTGSCQHARELSVHRS